MKKNFKFMLAAALGFFGLSNASAQDLNIGSTVTDTYYKYTLTTAPVMTETDKYTAEVELTEVRSGKNPVVDGKIYFPANGVITTTYGAEEYTLTLTSIDDTNLPLKNLTATEVEIPATLTAIPEDCFKGCSEMTKITFATGSQVETIGEHAFATTKITDFNFAPCEKLAYLPNEVFVESATQNNTYITKVTLPTSPLFKHINGAFRNLTNLGKGEGNGIINLENTWIQEVIANAFDGCDNLKTLKLPGNKLQYVDAAALDGSSVENLEINVSSIIYLGGGTVNVDTSVEPYTYDYSDFYTAATTNLYGDNAINNSPLKSLKLTGTLTGIISECAFAYCDQLTGILDLSGMTFGSTGQIMTEAFKDCYDSMNETGIEGVKIGDITDNQSGYYTIAMNAFTGCDYLTSVEIGGITTTKAVAATAFGAKLKTVKIGRIKADGAVFEAGAFTYGAVPSATLELAQGTGEYLNANTVTSPIIPAGAFDMSAATSSVIKIGELKSLGGSFAAGAIKPAAAIAKLEFTGNIARNGLDAAIIDGVSYAGLTAVTFMGTIDTEGIATGAFANIANITTINFEKELAEGAVATGAFAITDDGTSKYALNYTCGTIADYYVNPFAKDAFKSGSSTSDTRFIALTVSNANLLAQFKGAKGLTTDGDFDIYLVEFAAVTPTATTSFLVYQNGTSNVAWGRYDLGSFTVEQGPDPMNPYTVTTGMIIPRYQDITFGEGESATTARVKLTLYGTYGDENEDGGVTGDGESLVYMVPLQVFDGNYEIDKTNLKTIIIKAEAISGSFAEKDINIAFEDAALTYNSVWATLPDFGAARAFNKHTTSDPNPDVITTQILWDNTDASYNVWGTAGVDHTLPYAPYAIYSISNPANYKGIDVVKLLVSSESGKIGLNWYYMFMRHFGDYSAAARVVWMDEAEATAIFGAKTETKAAAQDNVMYNLQGVRISAPQKGQLYIMNGKKYIGR
jgi:hypothetical protein